MLGILAFGFLSDNVLKKRMYLTMTFVTVAQIIYIIVTFNLDEEIVDAGDGIE